VQTAPETTMTIEDFLTRTVELGADGVYATHIKDIRFQSGMPTNMWQFFACVPAGEGVLALSIENLRKLI
jgi:hypothetical protein